MHWFGDKFLRILIIRSYNLSTFVSINLYQFEHQCMKYMLGSDSTDIFPFPLCTDNSIMLIRVKSTEIRLYLPYFDWFRAKWNSDWFVIIRKNIKFNLILVDLLGIRSRFTCVHMFPLELFSMLFIGRAPIRNKQSVVHCFESMLRRSAEYLQKRWPPAKLQTSKMRMRIFKFFFPILQFLLQFYRS